jgi:hypothetical protein
VKSQQGKSLTLGFNEHKLAEDEPAAKAILPEPRGVDLTSCKTKQSQSIFLAAMTAGSSRSTFNASANGVH